MKTLKVMYSEDGKEEGFELILDERQMPTDQEELKSYLADHLKRMSDIFVDNVLKSVI